MMGLRRKKAKKRKAKRRAVKKVPQAKRKRPVRVSPRLGRLRWQPLLGLSLVIAFVAVWLRLDPAGWFRLESIEVAAPTAHLSVENITDLSQAPMGSPLMALELDVIKARMERHPWVRTVGLRRVLPGTLYIHVEEHEPAARIHLPETYLVSREGVIFKKAGPEEGADLPQITGLQGEKSGITPRLRKQVRESLALINLLDRSGALDNYGLRAVEWQADRRLALITKQDGLAIELGTPPWQEKIDRLIQVLPHLTRNGQSPSKVMLDQSDGVIVRYGEGEKLTLNGKHKES